MFHIYIIFNFRSLEVAVDGVKQGVTKKSRSKNGKLKICKKELFREFVEIAQKLKLHEIYDENLTEIDYLETKSLAEVYQNQWVSLKLDFKIWTKKNVQLLKFNFN